jgi:hypothetical protein
MPDLFFETARPAGAGRLQVQSKLRRSGAAAQSGRTAAKLRRSFGAEGRTARPEISPRHRRRALPDAAIRSFRGN